MQEEPMNESQKYARIQTILTESLALKNLLNLIKFIANKYDNFETQAFYQSPNFKFLVEEMNKLKLPELNEILNEVKQTSFILALPIKMEQKFTLFFVLVPSGQKFDWHNHPKMTGLSKCIHGELEITTLDFNFIQNAGYNIYSYPKRMLRIQKIDYQSNNTVSTILPTSYNIHKIQTKCFSAFFDLLLPDYPDNSCKFFTTFNQDATTLLLNELQTPQQNIKGWDIYVNELLKYQKTIVKTFILK